MSFLNYHIADNVSAQLDWSITSWQTSITIKNWVNVPTASNWIANIVKTSDSTSEKVLVTNVSWSTLTITRGYDSSTPQAFNDEDFLYLTVNSEVIKDVKEANFYKYSIVWNIDWTSLVITLKNYNWDNPVSTAPVKSQIWDTIRNVISSLSITIVAWINWLNIWSAELWWQEVDLFVYLQYNSTSQEVDLLISRIPWAIYMWDFVSSWTDEKWVFWIINYNATDRVTNIWKFTTILSLSAWWYVWSEPTSGFTLINEPTFETSLLSSLSFNYKIKNDIIIIEKKIDFSILSWQESWSTTLILPITYASTDYTVLLWWVDSSWFWSVNETPFLSFNTITTNSIIILATTRSWTVAINRSSSFMFKSEWIW